MALPEPADEPWIDLASIDLASIDLASAAPDDAFAGPASP
jgi:hypothetical protein